MIYSIFNGVLDPQRNNNIITELFMKKENNQMMIVKFYINIFIVHIIYCYLHYLIYLII